jgi:hypothetical protein
MAVYVQCNKPRVAGLASGRSEEGFESQWLSCRAVHVCCIEGERRELDVEPDEDDGTKQLNRRDLGDDQILM